MDQNVLGILIAQVVMSVITKDVLKNLILVILLLVVLEPDVSPAMIDPEQTGLYVPVPRDSEEIP